MSHVYTVTLQDQRTVMHVEAKSAHEAKRIALSGVEVKRLNGSEILDLTRRGIAIVSSDAGKDHPFDAFVKDAGLDGGAQP